MVDIYYADTSAISGTATARFERALARSPTPAPPRPSRISPCYCHTPIVGLRSALKLDTPLNVTTR